MQGEGNQEEGVETAVSEEEEENLSRLLKLCLVCSSQPWWNMFLMFFLLLLFFLTENCSVCLAASSFQTPQKVSIGGVFCWGGCSEEDLTGAVDVDERVCRKGDPDVPGIATNHHIFWPRCLVLGPATNLSFALMSGLLLFMCTGLLNTQCYSETV